MVVSLMYIRTCAGCSNLFEATNANQKRCRKDCGRPIADTHRVRAERAAEHLVDFIGVDGEGVTDDEGHHQYVLLSIGSESLSNRGNPLFYGDIFEFLYSEFERNPNSAYVGFYLGYDFTQWLRTLTENRARMLLSPEGIAARQPKSPTMHIPFMVTVGEDWDIDLLAGKRFKLRPHVARGSTPAPTMYICDAGPFFQSSFLSVIDPAGWPAGDYPISAEDYQVIMEGKNLRSTASFDKSMIRYNITENRALSAVMGHLNQGFVSAGVRLKRNQWFGPGQAANAWLTDHSDHTADGVREVTPSEVLAAAIASYYGGWFEDYAHGLIPDESYENDLNSAYPHAITELPCLLHGEWIHDDLPNATLKLERGTVLATGTHIGSMPHRSAHGTIARPHGTTGWYWSDEIDAGVAARVMKRKRGSRTDVWSYRGCSCPPPMRTVRELYAQRIALGESGKNSPQGKALKLLYNSLYGKFAQSIGKPRFANPIWASRITSATRTAILHAIGTHPDGPTALLKVATDAVFFRTRHTGLALSSTELGAWDETVHHNLTLFMPGVYWDDVTRQRLADGQSPKLKSRGVSAAALSQCVAAIDAQFAEFNPDTDEWPTATIPLTFAMTTAKQAVMRHKWDTAGDVATDSVRVMSADPSNKRCSTSTYTEGGILRTKIHQFVSETTPYDKRFGMDLAEDKADDPISADGAITTLLHDMFTW
jgi:hypothetical protein